MLTKRAQIAIKVEAAEGTAEVLAGADAILVQNPKFTQNRKVYDRENVAVSLSPFSAVPGEYSATIEFDCELKGSGTAGTAPEYGKALLGCGFAETLVAVTSATYKPASASIGSYTVALYMDGKKYQIAGARGDVSLKFTAGSPGLLHFVFTGTANTITDVALLTTSVAYQTTTPIIFAGAAIMTVDSLAAKLASLEIKMNNTVQLRQSPNTVTGYFSAVITGRRPTMSFDPEECLVATYDFYDKLNDGNLGALSIALTGAAGNITTITAPKVQYVDISHSDRGGLATLGIDCLLSRNAGDDELVIAFT